MGGMGGFGGGEVKPKNPPNCFLGLKQSTGTAHPRPRALRAAQRRAGLLAKLQDDHGRFEVVA